MNVARTWLREMADGAAAADIHIQTCMTLPKELLQSVETTSVTKIRASEDYLLAEVRGYLQYLPGSDREKCYSFGI